MRRCVWFLGLALAVQSTALATISITPAQPTRFDAIQATIRTWAPASNYGAAPIRVSRNSNEITLEVTWSAPGAGLTVMTEREQTAHIGLLAPGTYTIVARHQGALNFTESLSFTVSAGTSWQPNSSPLDTLQWRMQSLRDGFSQPSPFTQECICRRYPDLFDSDYCPLCGRRLRWPALVLPDSLIIWPPQGN